jgi:hypothetical protein
MSESQTLGKLAEALAKAQAQMGPALKAAKNPFFKSTYARLEDVIEAIRVPLSDNGLSWVQPIEEEGEYTYLVTKLMHTSGEWISGRLKLLLNKRDMQSTGAAITYAKRFSLSAMVGLAEEDDDGADGDDKQKKFLALVKKSGWSNVELGQAVARLSHGKASKASQLSDEEFNELCRELDKSIVHLVENRK